jgi:uncharacterized membrane protein|tara:strand:+ start:428 stop:742 length:315 start_codon:yes stop_codon:yes gene_type:complete
MSISNNIIKDIDNQVLENEKENREKIENPKNSSRLQSNNRILLKSIIFRIIALIITFSITYLYTNNLRNSLKVSFFIEFIQFFSYITYEILWNNIKWGYAIANI